MDGVCSAAIVNYYFKKQNIQNSIFIETNFSKDFPFNIIEKDEKVIIVDFSLQKDGDMEKLAAITKDIIWIDHHKTAIEKHKDFKCNGLLDINFAGCVLTWKYFFPDKDMPKIVDMLGSYDIWDFTKYGEQLNQLQCGIRLEECNPESANWNKWLSGKEFNELFKIYIDVDTIDDIIKKGRIALQYRDNVWASLIKSFSFFCNFEGYKCVCINAGSVSSQIFDTVKEDYDIMIPFCFDGKQWTVSMYAKNKEIDVSIIAKKYGGGGHKNAAGFQCKELPFIKENINEA
jgi:oligoribonuclease NrnB/cAMP/cGMP phosphodiesterase (DHH superfamily)